MAKPPATPVAQLKNIGPKTAPWLHAIGVHTRDDLEAMGALMAYKIIQHQQGEVNLLWLYAHEGALQNRAWNSFSAEERDAMRAAAEGDLEIRYGA